MSQGSPHRVVAMGPHAWLVEPAGSAPAEYAATVREQRGNAVVDVVPAASTVLVTVADRGEPAFADWLRSVEVSQQPRASAPGVEIPVFYDGADLDAVATATGLDAAAVIARHTAATYTCAFCGFAPGFGYLGGLDPALHLPRRSTPRTIVPRGSVAIAAEHSAVYPAASPGGWHLLGRTDVELWRTDRDPPALITPGTTVRFVAVER